MGAIQWRKVSVKTYESACGRFQIINMSMTTRPKWVLFDHWRHDACCPQYTWTGNCSTIANGKRLAERILRSEK